MADNTQYMVKWGPKGFLVSPEKIVPFTDLGTSHSLKSDYQVDTSGPEPVNVRGREPQTITFKTKYLSAAGVDPKGQMHQWYDLIGMTYPMYIGGKQFGPPLLQLEKANYDNFLYAPNGYIIGVEVALTFNEYVGPERVISQKTFDAWLGKTDERHEALNAGPSKDEKNAIKVTYPWVEDGASGGGKG